MDSWLWQIVGKYTMTMDPMGWTQAQQNATFHCSPWKQDLKTCGNLPWKAHQKRCGGGDGKMTCQKTSPTILASHIQIRFGRNQAIYTLLPPRQLANTTLQQTSIAMESP